MENSMSITFRLKGEFLTTEQTNKIKSVLDFAEKEGLILIGLDNYPMPSMPSQALNTTSTMLRN